MTFINNIAQGNKKYQEGFMHNGWITYLYQFIIGGIFFAAGTIFVVKVKSANLKLSADRKWVTALVIGYFGLAIVFGVWTLLAIHT